MTRQRTKPSLLGAKARKATCQRIAEEALLDIKKMEMLEPVMSITEQASERVTAPPPQLDSAGAWLKAWEVASRDKNVFPNFSICSLHIMFSWFSPKCLASCGLQIDSYRLPSTCSVF